MNLKCKYLGNLNSYKRRDYFHGVALFFVFTFPLGIIFSKEFILIPIVLCLLLIIYILRKYNDDDNLIVFNDDKIFYKKNDKLINFKYEEIEELKIYTLPKGNSHHRLKHKGVIYKYHFEVNGFYYSKYNSIQELLFNCNPNILIFEKVPFDLFRYFILRGEVRRIRVK